MGGARSGACSVYHANRSLAGGRRGGGGECKTNAKGENRDGERRRGREGTTSEFWLHVGDADTAAARVINIMEKREGVRREGEREDCKKSV